MEADAVELDRQDTPHAYVEEAKTAVEEEENTMKPAAAAAEIVKENENGEEKKPVTETTVMQAVEKQAAGKQETPAHAYVHEKQEIMKEKEESTVKPVVAEAVKENENINAG